MEKKIIEKSAVEMKREIKINETFIRIIKGDITKENSEAIGILVALIKCCKSIWSKF